MSIDRHYLRGYAKAMLVFEKLAYEDTRTPAELAASAQAGAALQPSLDSFLDNVYNSKWNAGRREADNRQYHQLDPSLDGSEYRNQVAYMQHEVDKAKHDYDTAKFGTGWYYKRQLDNKQDEFDDWLRNTDTRAAKNMATENNALSFEQAARQKARNGSTYIGMPGEHTDWETRVGGFQSVLEGFQNKMIKNVRANPSGTFLDPNMTAEERRLNRNIARISVGADQAQYHPIRTWNNRNNSNDAAAVANWYREQYKREYGRYPAPTEFTDYMRTNAGRFRIG